MNLSSKKFHIKVCGMRDAENIGELVRLPIDFIGYIFYPKSKRYVGENPTPEIFNAVPGHIQKTGVFVNEELEKVIDIAEKYKLRFVQLHGNESENFCRRVKARNIGVIKALSIDGTFDFNTLEKYLGTVDYFLFDTAGKGHGGTGKKFDWEILHSYPFDTPYFLAGGISAEDGDKVNQLKFKQLHTLDLNSKFETAPAFKDMELLRKFISQLKI